MVETDKTPFMRAFEKAFDAYKNKKIVIYGTGANAANILQNFPDCNIIGLMDGYKVSGTAHGKTILSYDNVIRLGADMIIIAARPVIVELIRKRVSGFCEKYGIELFSSAGERLELEKGYADAAHPYFEVSRETLIAEVNTHDVISLDIFDTLIMRKTLFPADVFAIMEERTAAESQFAGLADTRMNAELALSREGIPSFNKIYDELQRTMGLTDIECKRLKQLENDVEKSVLTSRAEMVSVLNYAVSAGKKVYLTTDMYFSKKWLGDMLAGLGITGYEDILVSCEYNTGKGQLLFEELKKRAGGKKILHIGDSEASDVEAAARKGIDSFRIYSAYDMLQISTYQELLYCADSLADRIFIGMFIEKIFNSPFALHHSEGRGHVRGAEEIGYLFAAPAITQFMMWFISRVKADKMDYILFAARDGFLINQLYDIAVSRMGLKAMPQAAYLLTSRIICIAATIFDGDDIRASMAVPFEGNPDILLTKRFMLDEDNILPYEKEGFENTENYILQHEEKIIHKAEEIRSRYLNYIDSLGIDGAEKIAFFDFVSSGTCQLALNRLLNTTLKGYYFHRFGTGDPQKQALSIQSLFKSEGLLAANSLFMESLLTSFEPTFKCIGADGAPRYVDETRTPEEMGYIAGIHKGIEEYFNEFITVAGGLAAPGENSKLVSEILLGFIFKSYTNIENAVFENYVIDDEIHNQNLYVSNIYRY